MSGTGLFLIRPLAEYLQTVWDWIYGLLIPRLYGAICIGERTILTGTGESWTPRERPSLIPAQLARPTIHQGKNWAVVCRRSATSERVLVRLLNYWPANCSAHWTPG